jgi:hypothetical protein
MQQLYKYCYVFIELFIRTPTTLLFESTTRPPFHVGKYNVYCHHYKPNPTRTQVHKQLGDCDLSTSDIFEYI